MSVADDLIFAIENRRVVTFTYDGHHRVVEPFLLGVTTAGKPALRGFQTAGKAKAAKCRLALVFAVEDSRHRGDANLFRRRKAVLQPS